MVSQELKSSQISQLCQANQIIELSFSYLASPENPNFRKARSLGNHATLYLNQEQPPQKKRLVSSDLSIFKTYDGSFMFL